jgi:HEPN domain-containing protein
LANIKLAKDWLGLANTDLIGAKALLEIGDQFFALSAFHAQQAAEKALKAYLVFQSIRVPKSHDIGDLVALIELKDKSFAEFLKPCLELTDYAVAYRYPDAQKQPLTEQAVKIAIGQAELALNESIERIK